MIEFKLVMLIKIIVSAILGACIGWERKHVGKTGIRTSSIVCMGACTFGILALHIGPPYSSKIAAQIVSGIGFLGAGVIIRDQGKITGITTAATLWITAAIGLTVAYGIYWLAIANTAIVFLLLSSKYFFSKK